ncbi:hypothetical protein [Actinacidiphila rubida]|uniref:hypothetical protein n=1 Tax=Actinacidiphila rubida TaxID=310780 RepID=UPI000849B96D|nr:hypothetical protein [Actinacidiphila rubida]
MESAAAYPFDPAAEDTVTLSLPATVRRWFRLTVTASSGWPAGQLSEFEVRISQHQIRLRAGRCVRAALPRAIMLVVEKRPAVRRGG